MLKKEILIIILVLVYLPITFAQLLIEPQSISINVNVNYEKQIPIKLTNLFNFSIYNINFTLVDSDIIFPYIPLLESNKSIEANIKIKTSSAYSTTQKMSTIKFNYFTMINTASNTFNVTILDTSYIPNLISIEQGDYIRFFNLGNITHTVTDTGGQFDKTIPPNSSDLVQFNQIRYVDYYDKYILFHAYILVNNKSEELTYNPSYDKIITFYITSQYNETTIKLSLSESNFSLEYDKKTETILKMENIGGYRVVNISLSANKWISFDENNFDIDSGSTNYVLVNIDPIINEIEETNKTHLITIKAKGINSQEVKETISVFIPYESNLEVYENMSKEELINLLKILKDQLNSLNLEVSPDCPSDKPFYDTNEKRCRGDLKFETGVQYNYTQEEIMQFLLKLGTIEENIRTSSQYQNPILDDLKKQINEIVIPLIQKTQSVANQSLELGMQNEEKIEKGKTYRTFWVVIGILFISFCVVFGLIKYNQYKEKLVWSG